MKVWTEPQTNKDGDVVYDANGKPREKEMKELVPDIPESQVELQNIDHVCQLWYHLDSYFEDADFY